MGSEWWYVIIGSSIIINILLWCGVLIMQEVMHVVAQGIWEISEPYPPPIFLWTSPCSKNFAIVLQKIFSLCLKFWSVVPFLQYTADIIHFLLPSIAAVEKSAISLNTTSLNIIYLFPGQIFLFSFCLCCSAFSLWCVYVSISFIYLTWNWGNSRSVGLCISLVLESNDHYMFILSLLSFWDSN